MITNCKHMKKDKSHITHMFLLGKHKAKNPTIIYYVYIMAHETISYKTLIQELSVQYTIVSHFHTKNWLTHAPIYCLLTTCLHCAIPTDNNPNE